MKKWQLRFDVIAHVTIEVEADSEQEAEKLAQRELEHMIESNNIDFYTSCFECEDVTEDYEDEE